MNTNQHEQEAHEMIDHIFQEILPNYGMAERPAQIKLSHDVRGHVGRQDRLV